MASCIAARSLLIVLAAWLLMLAWSKPWLARFRYGPLEWLWRCLTYGQRRRVPAPGHAQITPRAT